MTKYYIYTYWVYDKFGKKVVKQKRVPMTYFKGTKKANN